MSRFDAYRHSFPNARLTRSKAAVSSVRAREGEHYFAARLLSQLRSLAFCRRDVHPSYSSSKAMPIKSPRRRIPLQWISPATT